MANLSGVNKYFSVAKEGFVTTTSAPVASGATTVQLTSVAGYSNGDTVVLVIDAGDVNKKQAFTGVVDTGGLQITNVVWTEGANTSHTLGAPVIDYVTASHQSMTTKGLLVSHNQDGTLKTDSVDSTQIKAGAITTPKLASGSVTADKTAFGANTHSVSSSETTTSATFTDLTTSGPTVTLAVPATGVVLVMMTATMFTNEANSAAVVGLSVSGANTIAPGDDIYNISPAAGATATTTSSVSKLLTGLNPGSTTFTMKYRRAGGVNATFGNRTLVVIPLS